MRFYEKNSSLAPGFKLTTLRLASSCQCNLLSINHLAPIGFQHSRRPKPLLSPATLLNACASGTQSRCSIGFIYSLELPRLPTTNSMWGMVQSDLSSINFKIFSTRTHNSLVGSTISAHSHPKNNNFRLGLVETLKLKALS